MSLAPGPGAASRAIAHWLSAGADVPDGRTGGAYVTGAGGDVRGRGHLRAVEFTDPRTGEPLVDPRSSDARHPVKDVIDEADVDRGVEAIDHLFG